MSSGFAITSYEGKTPAIGLLSAQSESISELQNSSIQAPKTTLEINQDRYNLFLRPVQNIDDQLVKKLDSINGDKQIIADTATHAYWLSNKQTHGSESAARSAAESLFGDTLTSSEGMTRLLMIAPPVSGSVAAGLRLHKSMVLLVLLPSLRVIQQVRHLRLLSKVCLVPLVLGQSLVLLV